MTYVPTAWVNNVPPPLSAANLNKLTDELEAQASEKGISHFLPTWVDGSSPALTDAASLNEMERVCSYVAQSLGLSYTVTTWSDGWIPGRSAGRFNNLEAQVAANRVALDAPPPVGNPIPANGIISTGGTYGGFHSGTVTISASSAVTLDGATITNTGSVATIKISTSAPVVIRYSTIQNLSGDISGSNPGMIDAYHFLSGAPNLTLDHCTIEGPNTWVSQRALVIQNWANLQILNCTITNTRGIDLWPNSVSNPTTSVLRNRIHNIKGDGTLGNVSNFIQLHELTNAVEIGWNEIINEYNQSRGEDVISIFKTSNSYVHDNMLWGQSTPGNTGSSSQGGITVDSSTGLPASSGNRIEDNQVVRGNGIVVYPPGDNNSVLRNRIVSAGYLDDGVTRNAFGYMGTHILPGGSNNHGHTNVIGYTQGSIHGGGRYDGLFDGCPEGDAGEWANNTHLAPYPGTITRTHENAEWTLWQNKLTANGVTVGA